MNYYVLICRGKRLAPEFLLKYWDTFTNSYSYGWRSDSATIFTLQEAKLLLEELQSKDEEEAYLVYLNEDEENLE